MKLKILTIIFLFFFLLFNPISCRMMTFVAATIEKIPPKIFVRLIKKESSFNPFAVSSQGAIGLGQLMPITINSYLPHQLKYATFIPPVNIYISVKYTKKLLRKYNNNWSLVLAAYNWGEGNVNKRISKKISSEKDYSNTFYDIPETYNFLTFILDK